MNVNRIVFIAALLISQSAFAMSHPSPVSKPSHPLIDRPAHEPDSFEDRIRITRPVAALDRSIRLGSNMTSEEIGCVGWGECKAPRGEA